MTAPAAGAGVAGALRSALPPPVADRVRLLLATALERRLRRTGAARGAALVFHEVAPRGGAGDFEIEPALEQARLDRIVGYLSSRYELVTASRLPEAVRGRRAGERVPVAVTFDDDLPSHLEYAAPVFERRGAVATAFLCGVGEPFWWQLLQAAIDARAIEPADLPAVPAELVHAALERRPRAIKRLALEVENLDPEARRELTARLRAAVADPPTVLSAEGAAELAARGWELGYHTASHPLLTALDPDELRAEVEPRAVGDGRPRSFAYPHGKAGPREAEAVRAAGYEAAYTGIPAPVTEHSDDFLLGRLQPDTATLGRFALQLARALVDT